LPSIIWNKNGLVGLGLTKPPPTQLSSLPAMLIGLIANPVSSKDIRRLTGLARVVAIEEKANLVARLLVGLGSAEGVRVLALDDQAGLVRRARKMANNLCPEVEFIPIDVRGDESDTRRAAAHLESQEADALVTLGGDGTVRAAVEGWPDAPLVPIAAGTNNAFALTLEPTVTGLAVATAVKERIPDAFVATTALRVETSVGDASAVIDVVSVRDRWIGARAIWEPDLLIEAVVTSSKRTAVGVAAISAALGPLESGHARWIRFGEGQSVRAVFGPGLVFDVLVAEYSDLPIGSDVALNVANGVVALDGERRLTAHRALVRVVAGPTTFDPERALGTKGLSPLMRARPGE
jgi:Diacylglycerol kinase catalytic domain